MKKMLLLLLLGFSRFIYAQEFPVLKGEYLGQKTPGLVPEIFAPGIVSDTSWDAHSQIAISPKGDEIYWAVLPFTKDNKNRINQIYYSKLENGIWTKPALADFVKDNLTNHSGDPTFSHDGNKLFFTSIRSDGNYWYVERNDSGWNKPIHADVTPSVFTKNGNAYSRHYNSFLNETPLCYKYSKGKFSDSTRVIIHPDFHPWGGIYVSPDEDYLIFEGYHYLKNFGARDLYICFKNKGGQWGYPVNMGDKINTKKEERFPFVSPDGKYLFFMNMNKAWTQEFCWVSTAIFDDFKKESIEKANIAPKFNAIILKSEDLDKYLGVYSGGGFDSKITISKKGNILQCKIGDSSSYPPTIPFPFPLECFETDKFKHDPTITKLEFLPNENIMRIIQWYAKKYEMKKE